MKKIKNIFSIIFKLLLRTIEVLLAFLIVGGGLLFWRLYSSPLEIKEYMPTLERYILPQGAGLKLDAESVELSMAFKDDGILHIDIKNLTIIRKDGRTALRLPNVNISYELWSLMILDYTPDDVDINDAFLRLTIDEKGQPHLYGDVREITDDSIISEVGVVLDEKKTPDLNKIIQHILSFDSISLINARVHIFDKQKGQRISLPTVNLLMEKQPEMKFALKTDILLKVQQQLTQLSIQAQMDRLTQNMSFDIEFDQLNLKELGRFVAALSEANLNIGGKLKGVIDFKRNCQDIVSCFKEGAFQFKTVNEGTLNLPDPLTNVYHIESALINGAISSDFNQIKIAKSVAKLKNGPTATLEVDITGIGAYLNTNQIQNVKITLKSEISSLPIEMVPDVWPVATGPDAHAWVKKNLSDGMVEKALFTLYFTGDELTDLYGEIPVKNVTVRYLDEMSPVKELNGVVQLWPNRVLINGKDGRIGQLKLTKAIVDLTDLDADISNAKINLDIQGPVQEALALIAEKPLEFPQMFGLNPAGTGGQASVHANLAFPLIDDLDTDKVIADVKADIVDGVFPTPLAGHNLSDGKLNLSVDNKKLVVQGQATVMNIPLNIKWEEIFTAKKGTDIQSIYDISGVISSEKLKSFVPEIESFVNGEVGVTSYIKVPVSNDIMAKVEADFKKANLQIYPLSINKPTGTEATMTADILYIPKTEQGRFLVDMEGFLDTGKKQPFSIKGTVSTYQINDNTKKNKSTLLHGSHLTDKAGNYVRIDIDKISAPNNDLHGKIAWGDTGSIYIEVLGKLWDLSALQDKSEPPAPQDDNDNNNEKENEADTKEKTAMAWFPDIYINANVDKVIFDKEKPLTNLAINGKKKNNVWNYLGLTAKGDKTLNLELNTKKQNLVANTDNFGDLLERLGITKDVVGGKLNVKAKQQKKGGFDGIVTIDDFSLKDPGFLVHAFSILGILDAITGDDLKFSTASIPFKITNQPTLGVQLEDAYMSGRNLGITFVGDISPDKLELNGSVIPAYLINSLPGKIPVIGNLFKDSDGGGLIGAKYEITGTPTNPNVNFKPLHSIAPGILGKLFQ